MLIGFLADPHANLQALEAVLSDFDRFKPDALVCLGDFVGYGAQPDEVVEVLRERCDVALSGNHDLAALGRVDVSVFNEVAAAAARWTAGRMQPATRSFLEDLLPVAEFFGIRLAHASFRDPVWEYVLDADIARANFDQEQFEVGVVGHTHVPAIFWNESRAAGGGRLVLPKEVSRGDWELPPQRLLLNPGGVGQPRDGDPRASWASFDDERRIFTLHRVEYAVAAAQEAIRRAGLPEILADRLSEGW